MKLLQWLLPLAVVAFVFVGCEKSDEDKAKDAIDKTADNAKQAVDGAKKAADDMDN